MLDNMVDNIEQCGQQNIVHSILFLSTSQQVVYFFMCTVAMKLNSKEHSTDDEVPVVNAFQEVSQHSTAASTGACLS